MIRKIFFNLALPFLAGFIGNTLGNSKMGFDKIIKPTFAPPAIVFPIVWSILYLLMGISSYLISNSDNLKKSSALNVYYLQLIFNALWTFFFFNLEWYLFSFIWIIVLIILVAIMIYKFYQINKVAALLQIPYLIWLVFASALNFSIYLLN